VIYSTLLVLLLSSPSKSEEEKENKSSKDDKKEKTPVKKSSPKKEAIDGSSPTSKNEVVGFTPGSVPPLRITGERLSKLFSKY